MIFNPLFIDSEAKQINPIGLGKTNNSYLFRDIMSVVQNSNFRRTFNPSNLQSSILNDIEELLKTSNPGSSGVQKQLDYIFSELYTNAQADKSFSEIIDTNTEESTFSTNSIHILLDFVQLTFARLENEFDLTIETHLGLQDEIPGIVHNTGDVYSHLQQQLSEGKSISIHFHEPGSESSYIIEFNKSDPGQTTSQQLENEPALYSFSFQIKKAELKSENHLTELQIISGESISSSIKGYNEDAHKLNPDKGNSNGIKIEHENREANHKASNEDTENHLLNVKQRGIFKPKSNPQANLEQRAVNKNKIHFHFTQSTDEQIKKSESPERNYPSHSAELNYQKDIPGNSGETKLGNELFDISTSNEDKSLNIASKEIKYGDSTRPGVQSDIKRIVLVKLDPKTPKPINELKNSLLNNFWSDIHKTSGQDNSNYKTLLNRISDAGSYEEEIISQFQKSDIKIAGTKNNIIPGASLEFLDDMIENIFLAKPDDDSTKYKPVNQTNTNPGINLIRKIETPFVPGDFLEEFILEETKQPDLFEFYTQMTKKNFNQQSESISNPNNESETKLKIDDKLNGESSYTHESKTVTKQHHRINELEINSTEDKEINYNESSNRQDTDAIKAALIFSENTIRKNKQPSLRSENRITNSSSVHKYENQYTEVKKQVNNNENETTDSKKENELIGEPGDDNQADKNIKPVIEPIKQNKQSFQSKIENIVQPVKEINYEQNETSQLLNTTSVKIRNHEQLQSELNAKLLDEISEMIISSKKDKAVINLEPAELGKIKIAVEIISNKINARLEVENHAIKDILQNQVEYLKENLNHNGLQFNSINVLVNNNEQKNNKPNRNKRKEINIENITGKNKAEKGNKLKNLGYNTYEFIA